MITKKCAVCNSDFHVKPYRAETALYCSKTCHARATVAGRNRQDNLLTCEHCGKEYRVPNSQVARSRYCSRLCHNRAIAAHAKETGRLTGANNPQWKGGIQTYRRYRKDACERCGSTDHLVVHHKDENRYNNELSNLETLCKRCHQMHHDCSANLPR